MGLVRRRRWWEESIALVGTPQNLIAEGLADLGLEVVMGRRPEPVIAEHLRPLGVAYDPDVVAVVSEAAEALGGVRANAAFRLFEDGADPETVVDEVARWGLTSRPRAREVGRIPASSDLEGVHLLLRRGAAPLPEIRRR